MLSVFEPRKLILRNVNASSFFGKYLKPMCRLLTIFNILVKRKQLQFNHNSDIFTTLVSGSTNNILWMQFRLILCYILYGNDKLKPRQIYKLHVEFYLCKSRVLLRTNRGLVDDSRWVTKRI